MELPRREDCFRVPSTDGEILGSNEMVGMKWLAPPSSEQHVILILNKLDTILQRRSVRMLIDDCIGKDDKSVRMIQTGRFEIFLETNADKGSACFDAIVHRFPRELPINAKELILDYCRKQASRDSRLYHQQLKFGNFSIIATYGRAFQQAPHIDMIYPNFQFGCILSENAPGTLLFDTTQYCCHIQTVKDLQRLWEGVHHDNMLPAGLALAMERSNDVSKLLRDFGDVLIPDSILHQIKQGFVNLPTGSVLSLPGSMIHAGPASSDFRAVIFFSGWPQDNGIAEYHPDTQYTGVQLCGQLVDKLWRQFGVGYHDRLYLLSMLLSYITHSNVKRHWAGHFVHQKGLSKFVAEATKLITPTNDDQDQQQHQQLLLRALIERTARNNDLFFYNMADFVRVSVNGLQTVWENQIFEIYVFFRPLDGKILLAYPYQVPVTWEGTQQGEWYTLEMTTKTKRSSSPRGPDYEDDDDDMLLYDDPVYTPGVDPLWFDGSNGILRDTEGNVITCFLKGGQHEFEKLYAYGHEQQEEVKPPIGL